MITFLNETAHGIVAMPPMQATLFWLFIGVAVVGVRRIYGRFVLHKATPSAPEQHHTVALLIAIGSLIALCVCFPLQVVLPEDQFDWIAACAILYGTCWFSMGVVMSREGERKMLDLIDIQRGAMPNQIEMATVKALIDASRFARGGLIFVALGSAIQMGHLVYKAHPELFFKPDVTQQRVTSSASARFAPVGSIGLAAHRGQS